ncbi:alpha-D-ribose 1-methylphosphonate 5-triphosphate synthase subunit PhnH [Salinihabitans flavidus]|uniref:Alpha-D-ribose 1-methylphosphonate 5-triphosphate synthase subunit PhnH n=1 Tax=Salinihabitans flavidus TaxID=569882 RepID=A0A1H8QW30_9RHOB|nr:phosphonate C-P lyase system protein PhnH [Salinihabitans flavidus]SEO58247.1 alpha-D-ribose 1-methylphosphonate 5-triphosphate synthase subunit PhnH [Salinihabitans flavidus]
MRAETLSGGFDDAPVDAAHAFRAAMSVMACPGRIEQIAGATPPPPLSVAAGTLILTLCDPETPLHLAKGHDTPEIRDWITFHTGAPFVARSKAMFALGDWAALLPLADYPIGTPEYPDRSTTLIVEVEALSARGATLRGPGIEDTATLSLPEVAALQANAAQFPLGLDFFFTAGAQIAALPRTTTLEAS